MADTILPDVDLCWGVPKGSMGYNGTIPKGPSKGTIMEFNNQAWHGFWDFVPEWHYNDWTLSK